MNKKELRKELEQLVVKAIEETLNKRDPKTTKGLRKVIHSSSKSIAKKFYKSLKPEKTVRLPAPKAGSSAGKLTKASAAGIKASKSKPAGKTTRGSKGRGSKGKK